MKDIEELAVMPAAVTAITPKVISAVLMKVPEKKCVYAQFFKPNRDLVGEGKPDQMSFPKEGTGIQVSWNVSPGQSISPSTYAYDAVTIAATKYGVRLDITNEAIERAQRDVIADQIYRSGVKVAEQLDDVAQTVMCSLALVTGTGAPGAFSIVFGAGTRPLVDIVSVLGPTISSVDYITGTVSFTGTVTGAGSTVTARISGYAIANTLWVEAGPKTITAKNFLDARYKLLGTGRNPDVIIMNDGDIPGFLYDEKVKWLDAWAYRGQGPLLNAEVGQLFGLKVVTTSRGPLGAALVIDSGRLGWHVIKRPLKGTREDKPEFDSVWYHYWGYENFGVVDEQAVCLITGGASDAV